MSSTTTLSRKDTYHAHLCMLHTQIEILQEENRQLKDLIRPKARINDPQVRIPEQEHKILVCLLLAKGKVVSLDALWQTIKSNASINNPDTYVRVVVSKLRARLKKQGIDIPIKSTHSAGLSIDKDICQHFINKWELY